MFVFCAIQLSMYLKFHSFVYRQLKIELLWTLNRIERFNWTFWLLLFFFQSKHRERKLIYFVSKKWNWEQTITPLVRIVQIHLKRKEKAEEADVKPFWNMKACVQETYAVWIDRSIEDAQSFRLSMKVFRK